MSENNNIHSDVCDMAANINLPLIGGKAQPTTIPALPTGSTLPNISTQPYQPSLLQNSKRYIIKRDPDGSIAKYDISTKQWIHQ